MNDFDHAIEVLAQTAFETLSELKENGFGKLPADQRPMGNGWRLDIPNEELTAVFDLVRTHPSLKDTTLEELQDPAILHTILREFGGERSQSGYPQAEIPNADFDIGELLKGERASRVACIRDGVGCGGSLEPQEHPVEESVSPNSKAGELPPKDRFIP